MANKIRIIAFGKIKEGYLQEGINEYSKRLQPFIRFEILELKDEGIKKESDKIEKYIGNSTFILDARGKEFNSEEFAELIKKHDDLNLIIGGPAGILEESKKRVGLISLSRMTFTHEMARLFLVEQVYRACMINSGRAYYNK